MKRRILVSFGLALALGAGSFNVMAAQHAEKNPVLVQYQNIKVTESDLKHMVDMQVPKDKQALFWANDKAVREVIANLFITRVLAHEAEKEGLAKKDAWILGYERDRTLTILKLREYVKAKMAKTDFAALAKEYYLAHPDKFMRPEEVKAAHILISTKDQSDAEALAKAKKVLALVQAHPEEFSKLADEYSQDPSVKQNHGQLGWFAKNRMVKPFADAAFAMTKPGEITGPVKTRFGYHIIKFEGKRPAKMMPFDEVKDQLIEEQKKIMAQKFKAEAISQVKSMKGIHPNEAAIKALVKPLPIPDESSTKTTTSHTTKPATGESPK